MGGGTGGHVTALSVVSGDDTCQQARSQLLKHSDDRDDDGRVAGLGVHGAFEFIDHGHS